MKGNQYGWNVSQTDVLMNVLTLNKKMEKTGFFHKGIKKDYFFQKNLSL